MSRPTHPTYKIKNWAAYNEALKRRGSLTIWFDPEMTWEAKPTGKRGRQPELMRWIPPPLEPECVTYAMAVCGFPLFGKHDLLGSAGSSIGRVSGLWMWPW